MAACSTKVTSIRQADHSLQLQQQEGYLLLAVDTDVNINEILLTGEKRISLTAKDLRQGKNFILVKLPAGDYKIAMVVLLSGSGDDIKFLLDNEFEGLWDFTIEAKQISYAGHLTMSGTKKYYTSASTRVALINKSSFALEYLQENFPELLVNHSVRYFGPGEDDFFNFVSQGRN
ncbi:hypothetical protein [Thalassomonas actiniarum]|uniref:Uncharacterized protein n=1 Tax=Thalassomonas actiniarum TaxID=485447 RepID=A0AAE9YUH0_9GAMM|nr:hypothetical protein [Thalassomonas actiniarum]WDE00649.1 hypothetical protein SG35_008455 [Thalassomonas actiniarum]